MKNYVKIFTEDCWEDIPTKINFHSKYYNVEPISITCLDTKNGYCRVAVVFQEVRNDE